MKCNQVSLSFFNFSNFLICDVNCLFIKQVQCFTKRQKKKRERKKEINPFRICNTDICGFCNPELCAKNSPIDYKGLRLLLNTEAVESGLEQNPAKNSEHKLEETVNELNIHGL